jgi:putative restriction endonuclease
MDSTTQQIKADFEHYLFNEAGITSRGPVSTYIHALDVLCSALEKTPGASPLPSNVWLIESPSDLMELRLFVIEQQHAYVSERTGIFSQLRSVGSCYFKNRFCSAAVRHLAAYRQTRRYEARLQNAFEAANSGTEVAAKAKTAKLGLSTCFIPERINPNSKEGKDAISTARRRINQSVFRRWIVGLYGNACCVTGLNVPDVLQASHIVSWASDSRNRMNPSNGLCLSATYHAAFDRHLISFDDDYRMVLSSQIRDYCTHEICANYFLKFEGARIHLPSRFLPDRELLAKHRGKLVS